MQAGKSSGTANIAAIMRAAHPFLDAEPWIFNDTFAAALAGVERKGLLAAIERSRLERGKSGTPPAVVDASIRMSRLSVAARSRYTEDELATAVGRGVRQYVLLGAGLDSFAYRRRDLVGPLKVFEIDYPATQEAKRSRLRELGIEIPSALRFVPLDFETQTIAEALSKNGYHLDEPGFFSWLGVINYLSDTAIDATLKEIAAMSNGTEVIIDYYLTRRLLDQEGQQFLDLIEALTASRGEPGGHYFDPQALEARLKALGFAEVWHFEANDINARYLSGRTDGLRITPPYQLVKARVMRR